MEEHLITIEYVKALKHPTDGFLCELSNNTYNINFLSFKVRNVDNNKIIFEVKENTDNTVVELCDDQRTLKFHLDSEFLDIKTIGANLTFSVGVSPVRNFLMIERHYFKNELIKSYEFKFNFCMPNSINNWETIYDLPELDDEKKEEMIKTPWGTKSDTFYFVDDKLIMHNKASYNYSNLINH